MRKITRWGFVFFSALSFAIPALADVAVFEDLLYWHPSQEPTSPWAYMETLPNTPASAYTEPNVHFNWSPGLRLGVQYDQPRFIDTKLYWTYFSTQTHESINAAPNEFILPEFFNGFTVQNLYDAARLNWKLRMNMFDGELGHQFSPIDTLNVRPFIGIKAGTIHQSIHSSWSGNVSELIPGIDLPYSAKENLKNNFLGIGPSFGIDGLWFLSKSLRIRSDVSTALLWGSWNIKDIYHGPGNIFSISSWGSEKSISSESHDSKLGAYMAKLFLGFEWTAPTKTFVTIKAGYEMQFWSNQLRLPVFQALPIHGDLTLQGATCGIFINL